MKIKYDENDSEGVTENDFLKIISKKKKDEDVESDLLEAFQFLATCKKQNEPTGDANIDDKEGETFMNSDEFRDWLVYNGYKYNEDQAEAFMLECDPKKDGHFVFEDFVKKIMKREVKKKGGMGMRSKK